MKKRFVLLVLGMVFVGLNCQSLGPLEPKNLPPFAPKVIFPAHDTTDIPINISFVWSGGRDPNKSDSVTFDFYLSAENPYPALLVSGLIDTTFRYQSLKYQTRYYWKVVARDQKGDSSVSPVWNFKTRYEHNNPPQKPYNPYPQNGAASLSISNLTLSWSGGDPDSFSIVTFNVYLGKSTQALTLVAENHADTCYTPGILEFGVKYYWKIVARDHYGLQTEGPVWNFSTEAAKVLFEDNFDSYPATGYPDPAMWTINKSGANLFITDSIAYNQSGKSVCFLDSSETGHCFLATRLAVRSAGMIQFYWRMTSHRDVFGLRLYSQTPQGDHIGPQLSIREKQLQFYDANYNWQRVCEVDSNTWYFIQLLFDCQQQYFKIFVNQELKVERATWTGKSVSSLDLLYFLTFDNRVCLGAYVDEIKFLAGAGAQ